MTQCSLAAYLESAVSEKDYLQHLARGGELLRAERMEEARAQFDAALALKPSDSKVLNLLGLTSFRLGEYGNALGIYNDLVVRQPEDPALRLNLGLVHLKMGEVGEAIRELTRARELDPNQLRTFGYLGLAYARNGEYASAREAFLKAGQEDLAREMEQYLAPAPEGSAGDNGASSGAQARASDEDEGVPVDESLSVGSSDILEERQDSSSPARDGIVQAAVRAAKLLDPEEAVVGAGEGHSLPVTVTAFATSRLIRPDDGNLPFELAAGGTLIVRVRGRVVTRTEGVLASGGALSYEPAVKRVRGRMTEEPLGSEARPMFSVSGEGHLVASPRGGRFTALQLVDDILYLREEHVYAFEERLRWENGGIPGAGGQINVLQFRGEGFVALRTRRSPLSIKLSEDRVLYVDADVLVGWIGRVVPRVVAGATSGDSSAPFVECTGEGVVLLDEPEPPEQAEGL
ncbi:MAG: tetratricopeptide repeat protein [Deltaproteobacteria bacterium]|nr:tetratricopeptide repeat protein [Deltaproteobacteria bacterium]